MIIYSIISGINKMFESRLNASVLPYVLVITMIGGILASSLLMRFYLSLKENDLVLDYYSLENNLNSGIAYALGDSQVTNGMEFKSIQWRNTSQGVVLYRRNQWGIYSLALTYCKRDHISDRKAVLAGKIPDIIPYSLYLADLKHPLSIGGNSRIEGNCYVPGAEINRSYAEGQSFADKKFCEGIIYASEKKTPPLELDFLEAVSQRKKNNFLPSDSVVDYKSGIPDSIINNFFNSTLILYNQEGISIDNKYISGNVIVLSNRKIIVGENSELNNIILIAPEIIIKTKIPGSFQAFASKEIIAEEYCQLTYPSVLALIAEEKYQLEKEEIRGIRIKKNARIQGTLLAIQQQMDILNPVIISMDENSFLEGELYSQSFAELKGTVFGSVSAQQLYLETSSATYKNHLINSVINLNSRVKGFAGIGFSGRKNKVVIIHELED